HQGRGSGGAAPEGGAADRGRPVRGARARPAAAGGAGAVPRAVPAPGAAPARRWWWLRAGLALEGAAGGSGTRRPATLHLHRSLLLHEEPAPGHHALRQEPRGAALGEGRLHQRQPRGGPVPVLPGPDRHPGPAARHRRRLLAHDLRAESVRGGHAGVRAGAGQ
ncbi:hypothetical protein HGM15179_021973, partial [Zosterops borbonicus]